jgi:hypothetical protein
VDSLEQNELDSFLFGLFKIHFVEPMVLCGMPGIDWSKAKTLPGTPEGLAPGDHGIGKDPENHVQTCFVGPF